MTIKQLHTYLLLISLCAVLAACSEKDLLPDAQADEGGKTAIVLSVGGVDAQGLATRAVITDGTDKTMNNFDVNTKVFMVMKSERDMTAHDGYEYKGDRSSPLYTVCRGDVDANTNAVKFDNTNTRYWDDAHARSSQLTIWAYAQKGMSWTTCTFEVPNAGGEGIDAYKGQQYNTASAPSPVWTGTEIYPAIRTWRACHYENSDNQDATSVQCQDLLFTNNVANNTEYSKGDTRLKYDFVGRHFPTSGNAELKFYHAMSKITIQIVAGDGFKADGSDFQFSNGNVRLSRVNKKGLFNIKTGRFEWIWNTKFGTNDEDPNPYVIPQIYLKSTNQAKSPAVYYTLEALVIPNIIGNNGMTVVQAPYSRFVADESEVMMDFTIDGNMYKITSATLYSALLKGDGTAVENATKKTDVSPYYIPLEAGKNYVFTFNIGKTKINDVTAKVAEWETVTANDINPKNGISLILDMEHTTGTQTPLASRLYKSAVNTESTDGNDKGYSNSDYMDLSAVTTQQSTDWYWPSNDTYYHFRAIAPQAALTVDGTSNANYFTMTGGAVASSNDYGWGAPLAEIHDGDDHTIPYDMVKGYEDYLYHAIGPTDDNIHITQFHMMSELEVNLLTTAEDTPERVNLSSATVTLKKYYNTGNLMVGTGLISGRGSLTDSQNLTAVTAGSKYSWRVIPQHLSRTGTDAGTVGLCITTADGNVYDIPDLSTLKVTINSVPNQTIPTWLPGKKYVYNLTLKKTGIQNLTATIVDWETIEADSEDVQIK